MTPTAPTTTLPALPLEEWEETKRTLHLWLQIAGKVRMALHPKLNHWWHVSFYVTPRGLGTNAIPCASGSLTIDFDLCAHRLEVCARGGERRAFDLRDGLSVADFHRRLMRALGELGVDAPILAKPYDPARVGSAIPFAADTEHATYDPERAHRFWLVLAWVDRVLTLFRARFYGKSTPPHVFWHSLDLAHTRFSGRSAPMQGGTPVDREAYSHEVTSFGFWPGDDDVREPAFYSYTYPEPDGLRASELRPAAASWTEAGSAFLPYEAVRTRSDPEATLLEFFESAYRAGATLAGWPVEDLATPRSWARDRAAVARHGD
jgi:hypothetical protein